MPRRPSKGYPDFDSPLNEEKAPNEPGSSVEQPIPVAEGTGIPDPLGYSKLTGGKGGRK